MKDQHICYQSVWSHKIITVVKKINKSNSECSPIQFATAFVHYKRGGSGGMYIFGVFSVALVSSLRENRNTLYGRHILLNEFSPQRGINETCSSTPESEQTEAGRMKH